MDKYPEKIESISRLLQERAVVFPIRDSSFERLNSGLQAFAEDLINDSNFEDYQYDLNLVEGAVRFIDTPIFICGSMKSGTTLLARLFDSHPDMLVMPGDSHFVNQLSKWNRDQFKEIATYWIHRIVNPTGQEPFWFFGTTEESFKIFLSYLRYFLLHTEKEVFICVVMSFYVVQSILSGSFSGRYWVEKTPHNELHAQKLSMFFPKAKFIHVLRDPLDNIASLMKLDAYREWKTSALSHAYTIKHLFLFAKKNLASLGNDRYLIIKYEDLTKDPPLIMKKICEFIGVPFDQKLLIPTENGRPTVSNSMFKSDRVKGEILNREQTGRYLNELDRNEIEDVVTTLYPYTLDFGYGWDAVSIARYRKKGFKLLIHNLKFFLGRV